jgi:hypothetical protein
LFNPLIGILASSGAVAGGSYESIATANGTGSSNTISFTSIPSTYKHLQIRGILRSTRSDPYTYGSIRFNGDGSGTTNYTSHHLIGDGSSATSGGTPNTAAIDINQIIAASSYSENVTAIVIDILDYSATTKYKTVRHLYGDDRNAYSAYNGHINFSSGLWKNTAAINQINISDNVANWSAYSTLALYGIKD